MASKEQKTREYISKKPQSESHQADKHLNQVEKQTERDAEARQYAAVQEEAQQPSRDRRSLFRPDTEKQNQAHQWQKCPEPYTDVFSDRHQNNIRTVQNNNGASSSGGVATRTVTLMRQKIHQSLPTLVLTLNTQNEQEKGRHLQKMKNKTEQEQEHDFHDALNSFERMLVRNVDEFRQTVMSARPDPKDSDYREKKVAYVEYVKGATLMIEHMRKTITDLLTRYRLFLEDVWVAITNGEDPTPIRRQFEEHVDNYIQQRWDPIFDQVDRLAEQVEGPKSTKTNE